METFDDENDRQRWRVKDSIYSLWRELPGLYSCDEIWAMLDTRRFSDAMPANEPLPEESASRRTRESRSR